MYLKWFLAWLLNWFKPEVKDDYSDFPGLSQEPVDFRDLTLGTIQEFTEVPEEYMIPYQLKVTHQRGNPHCVGHTGATMKGEKERREQNFIDFDPVWLYNECKKIDNLPNIRGTSFSACFKTLQKKGIKRLDGEGDISDYRIGGYATIQPLTYKNIKHAIYQNGIVFAGFTGSNGGWAKSLKGYIRKPVKGEKKWGHATALIGYNKDYIIGQNSWGETWGNNGWFYFNEKYMPFAAWAILTDLPNNWKELMGLKEKPKYAFSNNLYYPMKNQEVAKLQDCLKDDGCFPLEINSTGYFGSLTVEAVKKFQKKHNIQPVAGYVGPVTRKKLNEIFS